MACLDFINFLSKENWVGYSGPTANIGIILSLKMYIWREDIFLLFTIFHQSDMITKIIFFHICIMAMPGFFIMIGSSSTIFCKTVFGKMTMRYSWTRCIDFIQIILCLCVRLINSHERNFGQLIQFSLNIQS